MARIAVIFMVLYLSYGIINKFRAGQLVKTKGAWLKGKM